MLANSLPSIAHVLNTNGENIELEAKFGYYSTKGFKSDVPYVHFERLQKKLRDAKYPETIVESQVASSVIGEKKHIRRITTIPRDNSLNESIIWQTKTRLQDFEFHDYDLRISASQEIPLIEPPIDFQATNIRERTRYTFQYSELVQIDMTEVMMTGSDNRCEKLSQISYEVEVEFTGKVTELAQFQDALEVIFKWLRGSYNIYSNDQKNRLIRDINQILSVRRVDNLDKGVLVTARNINRRDLVFGGIVGNAQTSYVISYKADGLRKMLLLHTTGVWLVFPPYEYNLVLMPINQQLKDFLTKFNGTVIDGELVILKDTNSKILHYFLGFDCLAFQRNARIQDSPYFERRKIIEAIAKVFTNNFLTVTTKDTELLATPEDYFILVKKFLDNRKDLAYNDDGLIFTPQDTVYNPRSDRLPLYKRRLTETPDVCKWKPVHDITIDLALRYELVEDNCHVLLEAFDKALNKQVLFTGTKINPFTSDMLDQSNEMVKNKRTGLVIEFEWSDEKLRPRKIRYDKYGPNEIEIAKNNWDDIMNPITADDLDGVSLAMLYSYHNRIKRELFAGIPAGSTLLDIGIGRGGDLSKMQHLGKIVGVEPNLSNISELTRRLQTYQMLDQVEIYQGRGEDTVGITETVRRFIPEGKVDIVSLMLSLSFFWDSDAHVEALVETIVQNLKPGGSIIFLTIDGDAVEALFNYQSGDKTVGVVKMHLYNAIVKTAGQITDTIPDRIFVKTAGQTVNPIPDRIFGRALDIEFPSETIVGKQREYLVHLMNLTQKLGKYGIDLKQLEKANQELLLSPDSQTLSNLYSYGYYTNDNSQALIPGVLKNITLPTYPENLLIVPEVFTVNKMSINLSPRLSPRLAASQASPRLSQTLPSNNLANISALAALAPEPVFIATKSPRNKEFTENPLPMLPVNYDVRSGPARGDDNIAPLTCSWYQNLYRIATIGDGSCFIHSILKGYYSLYQENNDARFRLDLVAKLRRDLALMIPQDNPAYPGHTYWETSGRGSFPRMLLQEIHDEELVDILRVDFSPSGLQRLFNSYDTLGDEVYTFIADVLNIDIYVLRATVKDLYPHLHTHRPNVIRPAVIIIGNSSHYEVVAEKRQDSLQDSSLQNGSLQTVFMQGDPFIVALTNLFVGNGSFMDIVNIVPFDPDQTFVAEVTNLFTDENGLNLPKVIYEIFPDENDIVRQMLERLMPELTAAANNKALILQSGNITQSLGDLSLVNSMTNNLDKLLNILGEQGNYQASDIELIRDVLLNYIDPRVPKDIVEIINAAKTDRRLSRDMADTLLNILAAGL